jgi:segregation and condensation protein A
MLARLSVTDACGFEDLFDDVATRGDLVVTFLALLEMIRLKLIRVYQTGAFGEIRIYKRQKQEASAPHYVAAHGSGDKAHES